MSLYLYKLCTYLLVSSLLVPVLTITVAEQQDFEFHRVSGYLYINGEPAPENTRINLTFPTGNETDLTSTTGYYQFDFIGHNDEIGQFWIHYVSEWYRPFDIPSIYIDSETLVFEQNLNVSTDNQPPYHPSNPQPVDGALITETSPVLSVFVDDPDLDDLQVQFYNASDDQLIDELTTPSGQQVSTTWNSLTPGVTYYWYVTVSDDEYTTTSPSWMFIIDSEEENHPPYHPSCPNPYNQSTNVPLEITFHWVGDDPDEEDTVTYDLYWGTSPDVDLMVANHTTTSYEVTLEENTTYFWRVISWDNHGVHRMGPLWQFTTLILINLPPLPPTNPYPTNNTVDVPLVTNLSVLVIDPDNDTMTVSFYTLEDELIGTVVNVDNNTRATISWTGLHPNTTYTWYALVDDGDHQRFSEHWWFTTHPMQPSLFSASMTGGLGFHLLISNDINETQQLLWTLNITSKRSFFTFEETADGNTSLDAAGQLAVTKYVKGWGRVTITLTMQAPQHLPVVYERDGILLRHILVLFPTFERIRNL